MLTKTHPRHLDFQKNTETVILRKYLKKVYT